MLNMDGRIGLVASCEVHFIRRRESFLWTTQCQPDFAASNPLYVALYISEFQREACSKAKALKQILSTF